MLIPSPLSVSQVGEAWLWFQDDSSGETLVNRPGELLSFNSVTALRCGVSKGTADSLPQLLGLLGVHEYQLVATQANNDLKEFGRQRRLRLDQMVGMTSSVFRWISMAEERASASPWNAERFEAAERGAASGLAALASEVSAQPDLARFANIDLAQDDTATGEGSQATIDVLRQRLDAARQRAASQQSHGN